MEIVLWIVVALIAAVLGVYTLAAFWVSRTGDTLKAVFGRLRNLKAEIERLRGSAAAYSPVDPEPFGSLSKEHAQKVAELETALKVLLGKYGDAQQQYRRLNPPGWPAILRLPLDAWNLRGSLGGIADGEDGLQVALERLGSTTDMLNQMGWTVAQQVRKALEDLRVTMTTFASLQKDGIDDPGLDSALARGKRWEESFTVQAPVVVLSGSQEEVLNSADKALIARVHGLVMTAAPDIEDLTARSTDWSGKLAVLRKALAELPDRYRAASSGTAAMEAAPDHPIQWDQSRGPLAKAREQIERLGDARKQRSLDQLDHDKASAEDLIRRLSEIEMRVQAVCEKHKNFLELLSLPDVNTGIEWLRSMVKLVERAEAYHPHNWPRELEVEALRADCEEVANLHRSLAFDRPDRPLLESKIDDLLENARTLAQAHEHLRPRAAAIETRLEQMIQVEADVKDHLARSKALLNQAASLVSACPSLGTAAVTEAENLRAAIDPLVMELDHTNQGLVDDKVDRAGAVLHKTELAAARWREKVAADLETRHKTLTAKVAALNQIAMLDDPLIAESTRLLRDINIKSVPQAEKKTLAEGARSVFSKLPGRKDSRREERAAEAREATVPGLAGNIQQIKSMNDELQSCLIALRKVEEVEEPVLRASAQAEEARAETLQLAARGAELSPEGKSWPPSAVNLVTERGQLAVLEEKYQKVKETPSKALALVSALGTLAGDYRVLAGNLRASIERIMQDHARFADLDQRMEAAIHEWERLARSPAAGISAKEEIQGLIDASIQEADTLVQRFLRGQITYNQAHQTLRQVVQRLEQSQIEAADGSVMEVG